MKLSAGAVVSLAATLLVAASAYADSITPIRMTTRVTPVARAHTPLKTTVAVSADPAVLDVAEGNLQVEVKLASGECGGSFQTTPGITLVNAPLNPPPRNGQGYSGSVSGLGAPNRLRHADDRQAPDDRQPVPACRPQGVRAGRHAVPGTIGAYDQAQGVGCVYPAAVQTIASQLTAHGLSWRGYQEDMGADPSRESAVCGHPAVGSSDNTQSATAADEYAARHDPFVYFHSIIDDTTLCDTHVVNLDALPQDLVSAATTPNYSFITPDLCNDGHDSPCKNGRPGGLASADEFLQNWVPRITASPAFKRDGLLIVTFDEAATSDASSCCGEMPGLGSPSPGVTGPGGGDTGTVLLSPCIAPGTVSETVYNHYSMLGSVENLFGLAHLGYAPPTRSRHRISACAGPPGGRSRGPPAGPRARSRPGRATPIRSA